MTLEDQIYHFMRGFGAGKHEAKLVAKNLAELIEHDKDEEQKT